ncbi:MAG TPA: hydantoinase/oxoprolinase family protein [Thermoanaerobaculia bacterium]|jgi:5-oxoprolinase (ATP-hydrolysing)|nr:hydantoinase/oxoprolinase family protein [Thermoanaerobaculia bacterium]
MTSPRWQLWVDTGGTFTDCIAVSPAGEIRRVKVLSSSALRGRFAARLGGRGLRIEGLPELPAGFFRGFAFRPLLRSAAETEGILAVDWDPSEKRLDLALDRASAVAALVGLTEGAACELLCPEEAPILAARIATGTPPDRPLPQLSMRLATTRGTNALLERKGAPVAFFVTEGFADLLAIGTQQRPDLFALAIEKPEPLYAQAIEVAERLAADGTVLRPLDREAALSDACTALAGGATSAAVALLHAYREPLHERQFAAILREAGFARVAVSSDLAPEIGFVPRAATAVVEAYLAPILGGYLERVAGALGDSGEGSLLVMTSAGGLARAAGFRAKDGLLSGPAGGVLGAAAAGRRSGFSRVLSFDMGGTSTDVARYGGDFELRFEHRVGDAHLVAPALAVETVAAGGGSICSLVDRQLAVGPGSAGASPGPAAYGAGGPLTITDVNLLLGRLDPERFGIPIDPAAAERRIAEIARRLESEPEPLLEGFLEIANERMADAIRRISIGRGYDPAEYALVAFGGAGAQHACAVAELLGISTVLVPEDASLLSARGLGIAAIERIAVAQVLRPLDEIEGELADRLDRLAAEAMAELTEDVAEGVPEGGEIAVRRRIVQLRFAGQETALAIEPQGSGRDLGPELRARFLAAYREIYGYAPEGRKLEVEALRVVASAERSGDLQPAARPSRTAEARPAGVRRARFAGAWREVEVFERSALLPGDRFAGPCLIVEALSATVVEPGWAGGKDGAEALVLERGSAL